MGSAQPVNFTNKNPLDDVFELTPSEGQKSSSSASEDYQIRLPAFEGPLDLLLHLIHRDQVNIYDIPVAKICASYLKHLELMQTINVNLAGEFMVMAATLTHIKSLMILPRDEALEEEDPRQPLIAQLLEYERFKKAADELDKLPWLLRDIYPRSSVAISDMMPTEALLDAPIAPIDSFQLLLCLKICLDRTDRKPMRIATDTVSIRERVEAVGTLLEDNEIIEFRSLMSESPNVKEKITTFLAVLELARLKFIEVIQTEIFGPIQIRRIRPVRELNVALLDQF